jgi:hypothetical protein
MQEKRQTPKDCQVLIYKVKFPQIIMSQQQSFGQSIFESIKIYL